MGLKMIFYLTNVTNAVNLSQPSVCIGGGLHAPSFRTALSKLDFRARTICFRCLGKVGDFDQWEVRTWELLAGEVDQLGGRSSSPTHQSLSAGHQWRWLSLSGSGTRDPLGGGSSPLAAAFSRAAGYCTEKSEGHRAGLGAQRGVAGLGFC